MWQVEDRVRLWCLQLVRFDYSPPRQGRCLIILNSEIAPPLRQVQQGAPNSHEFNTVAKQYQFCVCGTVCPRKRRWAVSKNGAAPFTRRNNIGSSGLPHQHQHHDSTRSICLSRRSLPQPNNSKNCLEPLIQRVSFTRRRPCLLFPLVIVSSSRRKDGFKNFCPW